MTIVRFLDAGSEGASGVVEGANGTTFAADCESCSTDGQAQLQEQSRETQHDGGTGRYGKQNRKAAGISGEWHTIGDFSLSAATPLPALKPARASGAARPSGATFFLRCCNSSTPISLILVLISILMPGWAEPLSTSIAEEPAAADERKRDSAPCAST